MLTCSVLTDKCTVHYTPVVAVRVDACRVLRSLLPENGSCHAAEYPPPLRQCTSLAANFCRERSVRVRCSKMSAISFSKNYLPPPTTYIHGFLLLQVPYSGFLSREKTFANCLKIGFRGENFRDCRNPVRHTHYNAHWFRNVTQRLRIRTVSTPRARASYRVESTANRSKGAVMPCLASRFAICAFCLGV